jgi:hypothetical protein
VNAKNLGKWAGENIVASKIFFSPVRTAVVVPCTEDKNRTARVTCVMVNIYITCFGLDVHVDELTEIVILIIIIERGGMEKELRRISNSKHLAASVLRETLRLPWVLEYYPYVHICIYSMIILRLQNLLRRPQNLLRLALRCCSWPFKFFEGAIGWKLQRRFLMAKTHTSSLRVCGPGTYVD